MLNLGNQVQRLLSDQGCGLFPLENVTEHSVLYEIGIDSIRYMEFIVLVEEQLGLSVPDEMLDISSGTEVAEIIQMLSKLGGCP